MLAGPRSAGLILLVLASLLASLFPALPARAAYEEPIPEGQLVGRFVGLAYFQVWKHSNGIWQDTDHDGGRDKPGQVKTMTYTLKDGLALGPGWRATGARVRFLDYEDWSQDQYRQYGGYKGLDFGEFDRKILWFSAAKCREGKVWAEESGRDIVFHYEGIRLAGEAGVTDLEQAKDGGMDLIKEENRAFVRSLGIPLALPPGGSFAEMAEGYIYWIPYLVEVYGERRLAPNFSVEFVDPGCPKNEAGEYEAEPGKTYTATVRFRAGEPVAGEDTPPYDVVVAGIHQLTGNKFYQANLRYVSGDGAVRSQQGLEPEIPIIPADVTVYLATFNGENAEVEAEFNWTAQATTKQLVAVINLSWPGTDPLPYTLTFYGEGADGKQYGDNVAVVPIKVKACDFYVKSLSPGASEVVEGEKYAGTVTFGLKPGAAAQKARLKLTHNGWPVSGVNGQIVEFEPGQERTYTFRFTGQAQDSVLRAEIWPQEGKDAAPGDNTKQVKVPLRREEGVPDQPGSLTFRAVSQTRSKTRPAGTAKWTDWVTATLRPPTPDPPRSDAWIKDWWIKSASLTYPKRHPDFTIGCPYPPQGTRTIPMKVSADKKSATAEFQEDWAIDGAPVYCLLEGRMMAETPKYYTITARYTVGYKYAWLERRTGYYTCYDAEGNPRTCSYTYYVRREATGSSSGTVSGKLLVNGTGVDSRAQ